MGIETNETTTSNTGPTDSSQSRGFAGATLNSAPSGVDDFLGMSSYFGLNRIDATVEPYLTAVMKEVGNKLNNVTLIQLERMSNAYVIRYDPNDGVSYFYAILFTSVTDSNTPNLYPASARMAGIQQELQDRFVKKVEDRMVIVDARVILAGYAEEMARTIQMASTVVRAFQALAGPVAKNATIDMLTGTEFHADWNIATAREVEASLSPHAVRPRMDIGATLMAKVSSNLGAVSREYRDQVSEMRPIGVIGGYIEIREREWMTINGRQEQRFPTVFNITVLNSAFPIPGVGAILLGILAPVIRNTLVWANQWPRLSKNDPNPGLLVESSENPGQPEELRDRQELIAFIEANFAPPVLALQLQEGRDIIPGMTKMVSDNPTIRSSFLHGLVNFFQAGGQEGSIENLDPVRFIEDRFDGVYGDNILKDSRDVDYLYLAAHNGVSSIDQNMRSILMSSIGQPTDRARIVQSMTPTFRSIWKNRMYAINNDLINVISRLSRARNLTIIDSMIPNEVRPLGSLLQGFGQATHIEPMVTTGIGNRTPSLGNFWN